MIKKRLSTITYLQCGGRLYRGREQNPSKTTSYKFYNNTNTNNSSGRENSTLSDWEDFGIEEKEELLQLNKASQGIFCLKNSNSEFILKNRLADNQEDFELINSDDEESNFIKERNSEPSIETCTDSVPENDKPKQEFQSHSFLTKISTMMITCFNVFYKAILLLYLGFVLVITFPIVILQRIFIGIKEFVSLLINPISYKILQGFSFVKRYIYRKIKFSKKNSKPNYKKFLTGDSNNNAVEPECGSEQYVYCTYLFLLVLLFGGFFTHCWFYQDSKVCSINNIKNEIKLKFLAFYHDVYRLPGEDCMKIGRCCKGFMEAILRWITCLATLPIRVTLTAWPKKNIIQENNVNSIGEMKATVNKIILELTDAKDLTNKQQELIIKMKNKFGILDKIIKDKSQEILIMSPILHSLTKDLGLIKENITLAAKLIKGLISIRQESDGIKENMKNVVRDAAIIIKSSISKLQASVDAEQRGLLSKIESLELLIKEDTGTTSESSERLFQKVNFDLDQAKLTQDEIHKRLMSLKDIPIKYQKMSSKLKTEVKDKLTEEFNLHDELSKRTNCACTKGIEKFKKDLEKSKDEYLCFIDILVNQQSKKIQNSIKTEISGTLYDKTVEIAKQSIEDALASQIKDNTQRDSTIKAAGFLSEIKKVEIVPEKCDNESRQLLNISAYCQNKEDIKNTFNGNDKCLSSNEIRKMVKMAVVRYSADKIGLADFALESMGGSVIASRSSSSYQISSGLWSFLSNPLLKETNSLRMIIQPNNQPGDCWAFEGPTGHAVVQLAHKILVNAVTVEHLPASLSIDGGISSAPNKFNIYNILEDGYGKEELIGSFEYKKDGPAIQTFFVPNPLPTITIKMDILSNHGHKEYTCVYRLRVHGSLVEGSQNDK